jgi:hypothetical protein
MLIHRYELDNEGRVKRARSSSCQNLEMERTQRFHTSHIDSPGLGEREDRQKFRSLYFMRRPSCGPALTAGERTRNVRLFSAMVFPHGRGGEKF